MVRAMCPAVCESRRPIARIALIEPSSVTDRQHMRNMLVLGAGVAAAATLVVSGSAQAEDTVGTFEVTSTGGLTISVPAGDAATPLDLGSVAAGTLTHAPQMGSVTVTDDRASLVADWTMTATGSDFDLQTSGATPATDPNQRVESTAILYTSGVPTVTVGTGIATPTAGSLAVGATVAYVGSGSNVVTWNPTLTMTLLPTQVAGDYEGTVTHSVS